MSSTRMGASIHHNLYYHHLRCMGTGGSAGHPAAGHRETVRSAYSTRMRGGCLRYQAQYLRRIRIPDRLRIPAPTLNLLVDAAASGDADACHAAVAELCRLSPLERALIASDNHLPGSGHA